ncbi:cytochrome P450 [Mycena rosella]|uniref:Cytochrome P450 n=1 Tax=Mycena rosella TaxID=1033263 RepID=A0AAD7M9G3_MYCRO|nr:cytochrome P450 [Mycena rosella]
MSPHSTLPVLAVSLACHLFFKRYETAGSKSLVFLLVVVPAVFGFLPKEGPISISLSLFYTYSIFYSRLLLLITTYRLSPAHSLAKYLGPLPCKLSKFWLLYIASQGKLHLYIKCLHDKYGPIVHVGPNELSIVDCTLLPSILGAKGMPKGPYVSSHNSRHHSSSPFAVWDGRTIGNTNSGPKAAAGVLINSRDLIRHAEARKGWNATFVPAAIKGYESMLIGRVTQLVDALGEQNGRSVNISRWFSFFSFDFMGDLAFGGGFELMREGDRHGLWHTLEHGLSFPALAQHIPWCITLVQYFPMLLQNMRALNKFVAEQAKRRLQEGSVHDDLFYHLAIQTASPSGDRECDSNNAYVNAGTKIEINKNTRRVREIFQSS